LANTTAEIFMVTRPPSRIEMKFGFYGARLEGALTLGNGWLTTISIRIHGASSIFLLYEIIQYTRALGR
jgi:hypothetical protein